MNLTELSELISHSYESLLILIITAEACALIGCFLVLRGLSMLSDAISHSVLLGIVLAFFIVHDVSSPWLLAGAALFGVFTVFSVEALSKTGLVKKDDAVGIVFPLFFSIAVILISRYARNAHLDTDMVLMGEVILAPLYRIRLLGLSLPKALVSMLIVLIINLLFILIFKKELKLFTFDEDFASALGFSSAALFYSLMSLSSLTAVVSFDAVGAILVVSFLIAPGACAYLICRSLNTMLLVSGLYAALNAFIGYILALFLQVSMSGMVATVAGLSFLLTFLLNREGLIMQLILRRRRKREFYLDMMTLHIGNHSGMPEESEELGVKSISRHLNWKSEFSEKCSRILKKRGILYIEEAGSVYRLTEKGRAYYSRIKSDYGI